jgi:hypothetical protein
MALFPSTRRCRRKAPSNGSPAACRANEFALSALAVVVLMQALKHGAFRAPKYFCHLHRMGFASLYTILRKPPLRARWFGAHINVWI